MFVEVVRLCIVAVATAGGYELGESAPGGRVIGATLGASVGYVGGGVAGRMLRQATGTFERRVERTPAVQLAVGVGGALLLGALGALMGVAPVVLLPGAWGWPVFGLLVWVGVYAGFQAGALKGDELARTMRRQGVGGAAPLADRPDVAPGSALVDSSAAIDGRLLSVVEAGFVPGRLLVPRFVLDELQGVADAQDPARRRKGRRALDLLEAIRARGAPGLDVVDDDVPELAAVDAKLVELARRVGASIVTVDENLQRVAEIRGVRCLNVHRLAEGVRTPLVPGDTVTLPIVREGREPGQGVGFLEDGTMVVVTDGAPLVGTDVDVVVTSSVDTSRGRMFFASPAGHRDPRG